MERSAFLLLPLVPKRLEMRHFDGTLRAWHLLCISMLSTVPAPRHRGGSHSCLRIDRCRGRKSLGSV